MATLLVSLTVGFPWLGALIIWLLGDKSPKLVHRFAASLSIVSGLISLSLLSVVRAEPVVKIPVGGAFGDFTLVPDGLGVYLAIIAAVVGSLAVIFSNDYMQGENQLARYYSLVLMFIGAMIGLVLSSSLLFMFIFWEMTAFCSYALISFHNDDPKAVAGGVKALIMTQFGGIGLLVGAMVCYAYFGDYQVSSLLAGTKSLPPLVLSLIAYGFLAAAAAKSAQVPFHSWLPDAMEAPTPISALIHAATMVNAGIYLMARFYPAFELVQGWSEAVVTIGFLSAILGGIMAVVANDLKRTLAYSTISQLGYMLYGVGVGGVFASQFHLLSHSIFKALLFLGAGAVIHAVNTRDMRQMGGLNTKMPITRTVFVVGAWGLAGLPIANGFFSKELILESGLVHGPFWAYLGMVVVAGLTAVYSLRMVSLVFYGKTKDIELIHDAPSAMRFALYLLTFGTFTTWMLAGPFANMLANSLAYHQVHAEKTYPILIEVFSASETWGVMCVIILGFLLWWMHASLPGLIKMLQPLIQFIQQVLGFEWLNQTIIHVTGVSSSILKKTQTGQINLNFAGILIGFIVILLFLLNGG